SGQVDFLCRLKRASSGDRNHLPQPTTTP
ncbi:unnamed protein product, partial [Allacma fusca]